MDVAIQKTVMQEPFFRMDFSDNDRKMALKQILRHKTL